MKIKKLLIVPADPLVESEKGWHRLIPFARSLKYLKRKFISPTATYDGELLFYADIPRVLGTENVFVFGRFLPHFYESRVPELCPYPSCHGTPRATIIDSKGVYSVLRSVDAVLISTRAGWRRDLIIKEARTKAIPIALFDEKDHHANYGAADICQQLYYGFKKGIHYDLYFKKDLPLGYRTETILTVVPAPVRPGMYNFFIADKDLDIFFSGKRIGGRIKCQADRAEVVDLVRSSFDRTLILEFDGRNKFTGVKEYWSRLSRSKIALSPSGFVWDSLRHCDTGLAPETLLVAPKPYVETVGPPLEDGVNAILYDTEFRDGKYHLSRPDELVEKIKYYLDNDAARKRLANAWSNDVKTGHTIFARSKYIIDSMEKAFSK